ATQAVTDAVTPGQPGPEGAPIAALAPNDPLIALMQDARGVVAVDKLRLRSPALQAMQAEGVILAASLVNQGAFIGLLALGPRRSEQDYSTDDRQMLSDLATHA